MLTLIKNRGWNRIKAAVGYTHTCIQLHVFEHSEELGLYYLVFFFFFPEKHTLCTLGCTVEEPQLL